MTDRKKGQNAENDQPDEEEIISQSSSEPKSQVDQIIEEWQEEARQLNIATYATLYKFDSPTTGESNQFAGYYTNEQIPNRHEIGLKFGSGKYKINLKHPKGKNEKEKGTSITFRIHKIYDDYKAAHEEEQRQTAAKQITAAASTGTDSFLMVERILGLILPVMTAARQQQQPAPAPRQESPAELLNSYAIMQKILRTNLMDTAQTFKEYNNKFLQITEQTAGSIDDNETEDGEEPEKQEAGLLEKIIKIIEPFFGLIAQKSAAGQLAAQGLKAAPQFAEILQDKRLCAMIINHFDQTKGRQLSDIALKNIGIDRTAIFQRIQQAGNAAKPTPRPAPTQAAPKPRQTQGNRAKS